MNQDELFRAWIEPFDVFISYARADNGGPEPAVWDFAGWPRLPALGLPGWRSDRKLKSFDPSDRNSGRPLPFEPARGAPSPVCRLGHQSRPDWVQVHGLLDRRFQLCMSLLSWPGFGNQTSAWTWSGMMTNPTQGAWY